MDYICPSCKSENIQKATMTHVSGISKTKGVGIGVGMSGGPLGGLGGGIGVGKATNQTMLSQMTKPPKIYSPLSRAFTIWFLILFVGFIFSGMILDLIATSKLGDTISAILIGLLYVILIFLSFYGAYKVYRKQDLKNKEMITAYDEQYICLRCGNVFRITQP